MISEVFKCDRREAQNIRRHESTETTSEAYSHLGAEEQREQPDNLVEEF